MSDREDIGSLRLFFALWPEADVREGLAAATLILHERHGGRGMDAQTLHLTLVFLGALPLPLLPTVLNAAAGVSAAKFDLLLDHADCWRHIALLGVSRPPVALSELVGQLEVRLNAARIAFDHRPHVPHVTLLRQSACIASSPVPQPIAWPARDFVLLRSQPQAGRAHYEILGRWPLL